MLLRAVTAALLIVGVAVAPLVAEGQVRVPRVGVIGERSESDPNLAAFRKGLVELGYTEGKTIMLAASVIERADEVIR